MCTVPNASGGYNPYGNMPYNPAGPSMSYGQSLFRPQATPENYTYGQAHQTGLLPYGLYPPEALGMGHTGGLGGPWPGWLGKYP
jgi:hypothetical protein